MRLATALIVVVLAATTAPAQTITQTTTPGSQGASVVLDPLPATFAGTLPCADCPGIRYQLNLFPDQAFFLRLAYEGRNTVDDAGQWLLSSDRKILALKGARGDLVMFEMRDRGTLRLRSVEGEEIQSTLNYDLTRSARVEPLEPRLRLTGMYRYMADAGVMTGCSTGRRMAVAQEQDNAALESAYSKARAQAGDALNVVVDGRLVVRSNPDSGREQPALVVERFISISSGEGCGAQFAPLPLEKTNWKATQLAGRPVIADANREALLVFETGGRLSGSDGCNRVVGSYELTRDTISFGRMAGTRMACPNTGDTERAFQAALNSATRWRIVGDRLELFDATGGRLARFEARP